MMLKALIAQLQQVEAVLKEDVVVKVVGEYGDGEPSDEWDVIMIEVKSAPGKPRRVVIHTDIFVPG